MNIKYLLSVPAFLLAVVTFGQGVAISAATAVPDASAMLDVQSSSKGVLVPRMTIAQRNAIASPATGLLIFQSDNTPGFYYNSGTPASPVWTALTTSGWNLTGNSGITAGNFIGTTDNATVLFKTNNTERMNIGNTGVVMINGTTPKSSLDALEVFGAGAAGANNAAFGYPVNGYSAGTFCGIYGNNPATGQGVLGENSGSGIGVYGVAGGSGTGIQGYSGTGIGVMGQANSNTMPAIKGYNQHVNGIGIVGLGNNFTSFPNFGSGAGVVAQGENFGITSFASASTSTVTTNKWAGYFDYLPSGSGFAFIGGRSGATDYAILSNGVKSTMVKDDQNRNRIMYCTEAPEVLFQDYGAAQLLNGRVHVTIDPLLARNIYVSTDKPLKVFIQLEGDCKGVYVTNKTASGFDVIELQNGTSNTPFTYQLIANRADVKDQNGRVVSSFANIRFPIGPDRMKGTPVKSCETVTPILKRQLTQTEN
ncbi:hypothetical protein A4D02_24785 [Niastella koreensis]|uniref:Uncharacterized protein n=2 Tax=Niastella koreensis TaxID=354356 RepID=G8TFV2_NIAKG|nr:hypothetical protein [Niastella koreensis]AEW00551.1 hypothetical protein Niako_4281 [Niastella koreensis GR20-10]OQP52407.1 hypothetical protein A4D02_24785 [Niastella koreensis]